jgi:UDP-glucose 4-epimerase
VRVALVGGAGLLGRALCRALLHEGETPIVIDRNAPPATLGARFVPADILRDDVRSALATSAPDVVIHLAARVDPPRAGGRAAMRALHVEGTRRVTTAARLLGVPRFILVSSSVVYGARPTNPALLTESAPIFPLATFPYAVDKAAQEETARAHAGRMPLVIARPGILYAGDAKSYLTEMLRLAPGILPAIDGCRPLLDFVDVDDVASALVALSRAAPIVQGPFNIASRAPIAFDEVARIAGLRVIEIPRRLVAPALDIGALLAPRWARAPSYILDHLMFPFVTDASALTRATGFVPRFTAADALRAMLDRNVNPTERVHASA